MPARFSELKKLLSGLLAQPESVVGEPRMCASIGSDGKETLRLRLIVTRRLDAQSALADTCMVLGVERPSDQLLAVTFEKL
jgi:hypothetical protein